MPLSENRLVWTDVETFGLDTEKDLLLEVGFVITDLQLDIIDEHSVLIWDSPTHDRRYDQLTVDPDDRYVLDMHLNNGLLEAASASGSSFKDAQEYIYDWLRAHGITKEEPLCGSSVGFDREKLAFWMPLVESLFSYRNIDVSTLKEIASGYNPNVLNVRPKPESNHRSIPDCYDTINEFRTYLHYLIKVA